MTYDPQALDDATAYGPRHAVDPDPKPRPFLASILRTVVPFVVGLLLTVLAKLGLSDLVDVDGLTELVTIVVGAAYYAAARWLEQRDQRWGWLIGYATAPTYPTLEEAAAGQMPVPAGAVVARIDPGAASVLEARHQLVPPVVAGVGSTLPTGTPVVVVADQIPPGAARTAYAERVTEDGGTDAEPGNR